MAEPTKQPLEADTPSLESALNADLNHNYTWEMLFNKQARLHTQSVVMLVLNMEGAMSRVNHAAGLSAVQVEAIAKLNGARADSIIELSSQLRVKADTLCKWVFKAWFNRESPESRQALRESELGSCPHLFCLFEQEFKYSQWAMKGPFDHVFVFLANE
jgi:hypothetical protein